MAADYIGIKEKSGTLSVSSRGTQWVEIHLVKGLRAAREAAKGSPITPDDALLIGFLAADTPGVPIMGTPHEILDSFTVEEVTPNLANNYDTAEVRIVYRERVSVSINVGTVLDQVQTNNDREGNLVTVQRDGDDTTRKAATWSKFVPRSTVTFQKNMLVSPLSDAEQFVGTKNVADYNFPSGDTAVAEQWLCTQILGTSEDNGLTFQVNYEFVHDPLLWKTLVYWLDPSTGQPPDPSDITPDSEVVAVENYPAVDWELLSQNWENE
jgi:hypothetical protein